MVVYSFAELQYLKRANSVTRSYHRLQMPAIASVHDRSVLYGMTTSASCLADRDNAKGGSPSCYNGTQLGRRSGKIGTTVGEIAGRYVRWRGGGRRLVLVVSIGSLQQQINVGGQTPK